MNHHQLEKNNMYKKMLVFFANPLYSVIWTNFARLVQEISNFVQLNLTLSTYIQQHQADNGGLITAKNDAFAAMVNAVVKATMKAFVWASDTKNDKLIEIFNVQKYDFNNVPEATALANAKNVRDALSANIAAMASVMLTAADITAISTAISTFESAMGTAGAAQSHKTTGTEGVAQIIQSIDKSLATIDNLLMSQYNDAHPDLIKEYLLNRAIDHIAIHHSGISIHATDAKTGEDLQGVVLSVNGKTDTTDINGVAEIIKIKPDTYNLSIVLSDYVTQTPKIVIEKGKVTELEIKLVKS